MGALRAQVAWLLRGRANTVGTLDALSRDLHALQEKVAGMELRLREIELAQNELRDRQLDEFDRVRAAVAGAVDDLTARYDALAARHP
jgi:hypothetical protein